jgi:hypothetical protein
MRFQRTFSRIVAAGGGTTLGTDAVPTGKPSDALHDNQCSAQFNNVNGFPIQRVVVTYMAALGQFVAQPLPAKLYIYDDETDAWYQCGDEQMLVPGAVAWFDQPTLGQMGAMHGMPAGQSYQPGNAAVVAQSYNPGCINVCLVVEKPSTTTADPDGVYTFAMGFDISNSFENVPAVVTAPLAQAVAVVTGVNAHGGPASPVRTAGASVTIQADSDNTDSIWVGDSSVTVTKGIRLTKGNSVNLPVADASRVYVVGAAAGQKFQGIVA